MKKAKCRVCNKLFNLDKQYKYFSHVIVIKNDGTKQYICHSCVRKGEGKRHVNIMSRSQNPQG